MAKNAPPPRPRTALIISKEEFQLQILEQLSIGKTFASVDIANEKQLTETERQFDIWNDYNIELLKSSFNNSVNEYRSAYKDTGLMIGVGAVMRGGNIHDPRHRLKTLKERIDVRVGALESLLAKIKLIHSEVEDTRPTMTILKSSSSFNDTVFIIHGHDEEMKSAVQLFISRAGLTGIVLHEQPDKNRTVIEKLVDEGNNAAYVVSLMSPDDIQTDGTVRARQNVVLEIGYFIGKLGREKVRLLRKGNVEIPSDLNGILYENYDSNGAWKIKLLKEMKEAGLPIDLEKVLATF